MRLQHHRITWLSTTAVLVAGCSVPQSQGALPSAFAPHAAMQSAIEPSRSLPRDLLYVAGGIKSPGWVTIYPQRGSNQGKIGAITQGVDTPFGLAVDSSENLYVANYANGTVTVYAPGSKTPFETLTGAGNPDAVTVSNRDMVYVANQGTLTPVPHDASILVYKKGQTQPSQTIPIAKNNFPFGLALDSSGDLFATVNHYVRRTKRYRGAVFEFAPGSSTGKNLGLQVFGGELFGIATDQHNNLLIVDDQKTSYDVLVFPPGKTAPSHKIAINSGQAPVGVTINRENTEIWVTSGFGGEVRGFSYPAGTLLDAIMHPRGWAIGVAVSPPSNN